ncbi:UPF0182 family protein [Aminithiophilus ramosus]|uniref:UPF0182 protein KAR29_01580 n=2 Tax=Synergistales TaxID=649776 RepID=A0A9Q7AJ63_9BACT|nr:UPF0182 family protein [Aminithiophilus ramosus]QTX32660.1 UPF0182 family protein [Aminithiophilus ramosus]QVL36535.1 UPF0182 family protein [Synergistota bacterium]
MKRFIWNPNRGDWAPQEGENRPGRKALHGLSLAALVISAFLLFAGGPTLVTFLTELLWYHEVGASQAFWIRIWPQALLFLVASVFSFLALYLNWRPALTRTALPDEMVLSSKTQRRLLFLAALAFALFQGAGARGHWEEALLFLNGTSFSVDDPLFGKDLSFYIFRLPFIAFLRQWLQGLLVLAFGGVALLSALGGASRGLQLPFPLSRTEKRHLSLLGAAIALLWALGFLLARYDLLYSPRGVTFGASYTDVFAELPALNILTGLTVALALLILVGLSRKTWKYAGIVLGLWALANIALRGAYPGVIQKYVVEPNEFQRERPFIEHNIKATLTAYDLHDLTSTAFEPSLTVTAQSLDANPDTVRNIRLWDEDTLLRSYRQLQEIRSYYDFGGVDIDRYDFDGDYRQVMLAARELDLTQLQNPTWVNRHLEFTHGYGLVMNPVNEVTTTGQPVLWVRDLPPRFSVPLTLERPQIYYGEKASSYALVRTTVHEFDYPMGEGNARTTYEGKGGIPVGSLWRRILFSLRLGDSELFFSDALTKDSRILIYRNVLERVQRIVPFLIVDGDPYMAVVDGRLLWIVDAYTATGRYPYSEPVNVRIGRSARSINYIRNSVKVTVDAYDGTVSFYAVDEKDPLLRAWRKIFPGLIQPAEAIGDDLRAHLRYPRDLFRIQGEIFRTYHMGDPNTFYNKEDVWTPAQDRQGKAVDPYYLMMRLEETSEFALISPFLPVGRNNMISWLAARSDGANYGELLLYRFPKQTLVYGPAQIEALIDQNPEISAQLSLWSQRGSDVIRGNVLVIPIDRAILYVQPLYLKSENSDLPELKRVIVASGNGIAWAETLEGALTALVGKGAAPETPVASSEKVLPQAPSLSGEASALARQAQEAWEASQRALREADWEGYGRTMTRLEALLRSLVEATAEEPVQAPAAAEPEL